MGDTVKITHCTPKKSVFVYHDSLQKYFEQPTYRAQKPIPVDLFQQPYVYFWNVIGMQNYLYQVDAITI